MTTNSALAIAARKYELERSQRSHNIPACLTDTFVGTILWLQSPAKIFKINRRKIIADCYASLQPDAKLIKKYVMEVDKLKNEDKIDENTYYLLRRDSMALKLLEEKTLGDADSFDSSVLAEIYNEMKSEMQKEVSQKYWDEKEEHSNTREKYADLKNNHRQLESSIENRASQIAKTTSNFLLIIIIFLSVIGVLVQIIPSLLQKSPQIRVGLIITYFLIGLLNVFYGFNLFGLRSWVRKKIETFTIKFFIGEQVDNLDNNQMKSD